MRVSHLSTNLLAMAAAAALRCEVAFGKLGSTRHLSEALSNIEDLGSEPEVLLKLCQGDCDEDKDCEGDLVCFQREKHGESVPGCEGGEAAMSLSDFCVDPALMSSTVEVTAAGVEEEEKTSTLLSKCLGDCDSNDDCEGDLICYQRYHGEAVPGCSGKEFDLSKSDYCIDPLDYAIDPEPIPQGVVVQIYDPLPSDRKLGMCEGHCDYDTQCGFGLYCYNPDMSEDEEEPLVPLDTPHCIDEETLSIEVRVCVPMVGYSTGAGFHGASNLKLSQDDANPFDWQSTVDSSTSGWCMGCNGQCQDGSELILEPCTSASPKFTRTSVIARIEGNSMFSLKYTSLCIEESQNKLKLKQCDYNWIAPNQLWFAGDGSFDDDQFVISQRWFQPKLCVTQKTAPNAAGSSLSLELCADAIDANRLYWERINYDY